VIGVMAFREKINNYLQPICNVSYQDGDHRLRTLSLDTPNIHRSFSTSSYATCGIMGNTDASSVIIENSLGTAFGKAQNFATVAVRFERAGTICTMVIGYDERRGLKARGIRFERRQPRPSEPQAFPASTGCAPPPNWHE